MAGYYLPPVNLGKPADRAVAGQRGLQIGLPSMLRTLAAVAICWSMLNGGISAQTMAVPVGIGIAPLPAQLGLATGVAQNVNLTALRQTVRSNSRGSGYSMDIVTTGFAGPGYHPVRIQIVAAGAATSDRELDIEFTAKSQFGSEILVADTLTIPAGALQGTLTLAVPLAFGMNSYDAGVFEDGDFLKKLSQTNINVNNSGNMYNQSEGAVPCLLFVSANTTVDASALCQSLPVSAQNVQYLNAGMAGLAANAGGMMVTPGGMAAGTTVFAPYPSEFCEAVTAAELPTRWLDYTAVDVICIPHAELAGLVQSNPAAWQAIQAWTRAGGNLWLFGARDDWSRLPEIEELIGFWPTTPAAATAPAERGWKLADPAVSGFPIDAGFQPENNYRYGNSAQVAAVTASSPAVQPAPFFAMRSIASGQVVAFTADDPFPGTVAGWTWLANSVTADRLLWYRRNGLSLTNENPDFWNFLIAGVGLAPVDEFRLLITLFVILIGPVTFFILQRRGKLHLMLFIVPAAAAAVTLSLFVYAVMADGLGIRVRARSFTQIDQRANQAVCWSRLSYFAGVAPSDGLVFSDQTAVYPMGAETNQANRTMPNLAMAWREDEQALLSGWLGSRTPTQYVTVRSRPTTAQLLVQSNGEGAPRVTNQLQSDIVFLWICDQRGQQFWSEEAPSDQLVPLKPFDPVATPQFLKTLLVKGEPQFTVDAQSNYRSRFTRYYYSQNAQDAHLITGRLEKSFQELAQLAASLQPVLPSRSYIAVVKRSPEVELGVDSAQEEPSIHIIKGTW